LPIILSMLGACGQKGDLYLPAPDTKTPGDEATARQAIPPAPEAVAPDASGESLLDLDPPATAPLDD
jgi:predicted small lipoprotein YifL